MEEDYFFNQSQRYYDPNEILQLQQQVLCHEIESQCPYPSPTTTNNFVQNHLSNTNVVVDNFYMGETTCNTHKDAMEMNHSLKPRIHIQKVRSSSESANHIASERKRRLKLTQNFIALSAMIPGLKKVRIYKIINTFLLVYESFFLTKLVYESYKFFYFTNYKNTLFF